MCVLVGNEKTRTLTSSHNCSIPIYCEVNLVSVYSVDCSIEIFVNPNIY